MIKTLRAKSPYSLYAVVHSHGWSDLHPFQVHESRGTIRTALRDRKKAHSFEISSSKNGIRVESLQCRNFDHLIPDLRWIFRLDDDLSEFYKVFNSNKKNDSIQKFKMGRLLRSQTPFEDLIKLILTTNCSWSLTRILCQRLVDTLGKKTKEGLQLFPTPEAFASKSEKFYRNVIRAGYRSPHFQIIGKAVCDGELDPESWKDERRSTKEIRREILSVPGAGPYVADNLFRYLGRYNYLGLDSWARAKLKKNWNLKNIPKDKEVEKRYAKFGDFKGLALWCDLTHDWLDESTAKKWGSL